MLLTAVALTGATLSPVALHALMMAQASKADDILYEPPKLTSVIVAAYNEERYLPRALSSLTQQNIIQAMPERFELLLVDSGSEDKTAEIAESYGFSVLQSPPGKLTARDLATRAAKGDVVFSADADTRYLPNVANLMLRHMQDPEVAGVFSPRLREGFPYEQVQALVYSVAPLHRFYGSNSCYKRSDYLDLGGFDCSIDQQDREAINVEEEREFIYRLAERGEIVYERNAPVVTSDRFWRKEDKGYIGAIESGSRF